MMEYRGYRATVVFDDEADRFHGEVIGTRDVITFQGQSVPELHKEFAASVDEYLKVCAERGREPDRAFSGKIPLRISPDIHRAATERAKAEGKSLNAWLSEKIAGAIGASG